MVSLGLLSIITIVPSSDLSIWQSNPFYVLYYCSATDILKWASKGSHLVMTIKDNEILFGLYIQFTII